jgi:hypothetical protein
MAAPALVAHRHRYIHVLRDRAAMALGGLRLSAQPDGPEDAVQEQHHPEDRGHDAEAVVKPGYHPDG